MAPQTESLDLPQIRPGSYIILYDGVCGLCNRAVQFILKRDKQDRFLFAALQSAWARGFLSRHGLPVEDLTTMYLIINSESASVQVLSRGRAALSVFRILGGAWNLVQIFRVIPTAVLDWGYDLIARNRYRLFGKHDRCWLPRPEYQKKFIASGDGGNPP